MTEVKAGDEVRVFDVNGRRMGQPEGGWKGEVVKVGRTLVHIKVDAPGWWKPVAFRKDTRRTNDAYQHKSFRTLEQVAKADRLAAATAVLRAHRIDLCFGHKLTLEQIEALAEVAKTFTDQEG